MQFKDYMKQNKKTLKECAAEIGVSIPTIHRYASGVRKPLPKNMLKIIQWSNGQIQPNDFYTSDENSN